MAVLREKINSCLAVIGGKKLNFLIYLFKAFLENNNIIDVVVDEYKATGLSHMSNSCVYKEYFMVGHIMIFLIGCQRWHSWNECNTQTTGYREKKSTKGRFSYLNCSLNDSLSKSF